MSEDIFGGPTSGDRGSCELTHVGTRVKLQEHKVPLTSKQDPSFYSEIMFKVILGTNIWMLSDVLPFMIPLCFETASISFVHVILGDNQLAQDYQTFS